MKKKLFFGLAFFILSNTTEAQFEKNSWETGILVNAGSSSISYSDPEVSDGSNSFISINILPAYYIFNGLSIESQIVFTAMKDLEPEFNFIGNLSYTLRIEKSGFAPYFKLGYGVSNSVIVNYGNLYSYNSDKFNIGVFNSSAGLKFLVSENIALRGELNCKIYSTTINNQFVNSNLKDVSITNLSFLGGLSFLF